MSRWEAEPYYVFYDTQVALQAAQQRVDRAETSVEKLAWEKRKLETRLQKIEAKVERRGRWTTQTFLKAKALVAQDR